MLDFSGDFTVKLYRLEFKANRSVNMASIAMLLVKHNDLK